jgi:predicted amidohydrolase
VPLAIATCQFPVSREIARNARYVRALLRAAKRQGADVAHFCEGSLSGYAGSDFESHDSLDWAQLREAAEQVRGLARELRLWVLLGASHPLQGRRKPHNSVYVIDARGELVDRYDKRFCAGPPDASSGDLAHYTPGAHFSVFDIRGVRCGVLICHDYRYPELYREYKRRGVQLVFHSYHAGHMSAQRARAARAQVGARLARLNQGATLPEITMRAAMQAAAASNHVWISCSNTGARESCWPSFAVRADGVISARLRRHAAGVLLWRLDPSEPLYDSTRHWRGRAMRGVYHSGRLLRDPRSAARRRF